METKEQLGISGRTARNFMLTEITPLLALVGFLLGIFAVMITPREEEPQINVTFANIYIPFPGATASEIEHLLATPAEQVLSEIEGVKHIYSNSMPGMAVLTVRFEVGENSTDAIVRLYNKVFSNQDWLPRNLGVGQPIIKPMGIDDVPIITATLWSKDDSLGAYDLGQVAHAIESEIKRVPGTRNIYTTGTPQRVVKVELDPQSLSGFGIDLDNLRQALAAANVTRDNLSITRDNTEVQVQAGALLTNAEEIGDLVVGVFNQKPVFLRDVAKISHEADQPDSYVWMGAGPAGLEKGEVTQGFHPAVTLAIAKKPGTNAVEIAQKVIERFEQLKGIYIPDNVEVTITRDYGQTADQKAQKLIQKLIFATLSVVLLVFFALGWREALIVGGAVVLTLAVTLFASWAWGFTLNRVSLFALIFSIGILVDDAIVVVENIHRHMALGFTNLVESIPRAVDEVGGPTILATFTVIAALLPMAFVTGLMGPYMSPIPINASMGMLISLIIAFVVTPWMSNKGLAKVAAAHAAHGHQEGGGKLDAFFGRVISPFLDADKGHRRRWYLLGAIMTLIVISISLAVTKHVVLKMLPFDNKSEFQVVVDMPEGTSLEQTARVTTQLGDYLSGVPEVSHYQAYVGTASPIGFNGLVRQYYMRSGANVADIQVNLVDHKYRKRKSHEIALAVREPLVEIGKSLGANVKVVEVPPGPPVQSPLVAEIYGMDYAGQTALAKDIRKVFESTPDIVDVDDSVEFPADKAFIRIDRQKASLLSVPQSEVAKALGTVLQGEDVGFLHGDNIKYAVPIRVKYSEADKADLDQVLGLRVRSMTGNLVPLSEIVEVIPTTREQSIQHKDLQPVVYVTGDMAGHLDSPLYGMFDIRGRLEESRPDVTQMLIKAPENPYAYSIKWDGEWQITYETFRDMGIAYSVGLLLIYLLVVAQFRSYLVPLVIMAPIPLTIIGIMPGHALLGAQFTATSMIGMIALAGIIVRNSILLVDFINEQTRTGMEFRKAVVKAAAVRAKPIVLTGVAAMAGAFFILDDPIFSGLAISLISGILVSTVLTLVVIPVVYFAAMQNRLEHITGTAQ